MDAMYRPVAGLRIQPFDTGARNACFLAEGAGRRWQINEPTAQLLEALGAAASLDEAAAALALRWGREVEPERLREYLDRELAPTGMVLRPGAAEGAAPSEREYGGRLSYLSFRMTVVTARRLQALSGAVRFLVHPRLFWLSFLAALAAGVWFVAFEAFRAGGASLLSLMLAPGAVLLAMMSTLVHELGHAAACRRFGCRHGNLGFGLYLVFPVLYMEVDETWRLPRGQRAVVAAAGMYFQLLFGLGMLAAGVLHAPFRPLAMGCFALICADLVTNLNPLFRFDGYWLLSDLLGIPNLRLKSGAILRAGWARLRGNAPARAAAILPGGISPRLTVALVAYSVVSIAFFGVFLGRLLLVMPRYATELYPALVARHAAALREAAGALDPLGAAVALFSVVPPTAMLAALPLTLAMLALRVVRRFRAAAPAPAAAPSG